MLDMLKTWRYLTMVYLEFICPCIVMSSVCFDKKWPAAIDIGTKLVTIWFLGGWVLDYLRLGYDKFFKK